MIPQALALTAAIGGAVYSLRHAWWRATVSYSFPRILMYHMVQHHRPGSPLNGLRVPPSVFESQLRWLRDRNWSFYTMSELISQWKHLPEKSVALTFDDGYADNLINAAPILERAGIRASFYVIAGLACTQDRPWYDTVARAVQTHGLESLPHPLRQHLQPNTKRDVLARAVVEHLKRLPDIERRNAVEEIAVFAGRDEPGAMDAILSGEQLRSLVARGHEIGVHSLTHPILTKLEGNALVPETSDARVRLQELSGASCDIFCYPNGDHNDSVMKAVTEAGFRAALSTAQGINRHGANAFALKRVFINEDWLRAPNGMQSEALLRTELAIAYRFRGR